MEINKNLCTFWYINFCSWIKFKSASLESLIINRKGVLSHHMLEAARSASVEPIGETQPIVKSFQMFEKLSEPAIWSALIKLSDGSESWYAGLPSTLNFCFCSSTGLILYSQCFCHLLNSLRKIVNGVAKLNSVLNNS